uniref:Ig-like domain-containing protein n=1 Tax=Schistocephalus solidus TaxID=70667 RepID=A0A183TT47_SCHSO
LRWSHATVNAYSPSPHPNTHVHALRQPFRPPPKAKHSDISTDVTPCYTTTGSSQSWAKTVSPLGLTFADDDCSSGFSTTCMLACTSGSPPTPYSLALTKNTALSANCEGTQDIASCPSPGATQSPPSQYQQAFLLQLFGCPVQ